MLSNVFRSNRSESITGAMFEQNIRRLANDIEMRIEHVDPPTRIAIFELSGDATGYQAFVATIDDDHTYIQVYSRSKWPGDPPPVAVQVAKRLDESSQHAVFKAKRLEASYSRIMGGIRVHPLPMLTSEQFLAASSELAFKMLTADRNLARHGFA